MNGVAVLPAYAELLREADRTLAAAGVPTPRLDAEVLLAAAAEIDRTRLLARGADRVAPETLRRFRAMIERRRRREPVAYVVGVREFWSLAIEVSPAVLIPRPETELLVEVTRDLLKSCRSPLVCDAGTGSGCVAIALARELPGARLVALDASYAALQMAQRNARRSGVADRIGFACSDWLDAVRYAARFDAIVSNPPYLTTAEPLQPELSWEPSSALAAGADGFDSIRVLLAQAPAHLNDRGWIAMEIGCGQAPTVRELAATAGFTDIAIHLDLAGIPRVLAARWNRAR